MGQKPIAPAHVPGRMRGGVSQSFGGIGSGTGRGSGFGFGGDGGDGRGFTGGAGETRFATGRAPLRAIRATASCPGKASVLVARGSGSGMGSASTSTSGRQPSAPKTATMLTRTRFFMVEKASRRTRSIRHAAFVRCQPTVRARTWLPAHAAIAGR